MYEVDQDAVIRTLLARFGDRRFQVSELTDAQVARIVDPQGTRATHRGRRRLLSLILGKMDGYRCATDPYMGDKLTIVQTAESSREAIYQIQRSR